MGGTDTANYASGWMAKKAPMSSARTVSLQYLAPQTLLSAYVPTGEKAGILKWIGHMLETTLQNDPSGADNGGGIMKI